MKFLDEVKIYLKSGDGGNGSVSFRHEKCVPHGGPDGGNGGTGGDVIIRCVDGLNTLVDYQYKKHFKANKGSNGRSKNRSGSKGTDMVLKVPVGTQVLMEDKETLIVDMVNIDEDFTLIKGGCGGFGNSYYKSSVNRSPRYSSNGDSGKEMFIWFCMKLVADIGIVGLPNAGKSSFLSAVSRAKPKIASYPFTTLYPNLGTVDHNNSTFTIADIPGLVENAYKGVGMGIKFLSHVERCKIILYLVDITEENIVISYRSVKRELVNYNLNLDNKQEVIILNKCDSLSEEEIEKKKDFFLREVSTSKKKSVFVISSIFGTGIDNVLEYLSSLFD